MNCCCLGPARRTSFEDHLFKHSVTLLPVRSETLLHFDVTLVTFRESFLRFCFPEIIIIIIIIIIDMIV